MKSISINCKGNRYVNYKDLKNFQGNLKELTKQRCDKLKSEILKLGWIAPVFVWNENEILDGHQRIFALNELIKEGCTIDNIPIVDIDAKTKKDAAKILLALNSRYGQITDEGLYEFMNLMALQVEDLEGIELADIDMDRFIEGNYKQEGLTDPDEIPEVAEEPITKIGDLWLLGSHRLLCGDSTKKEDMERLMGGKKADMVFTDPPYGVSYADKNKYLNAISRGNRIQVEIKNDHKSVNDLSEIIYTAFCRIKEVLNAKASYYITAPQGGDLLMMMMMMQKAGLTLRHMLIWAKNNHVLGRTDYNYKHEPILFGWISGHTFYANGEHQFSVWEIPKPHKSDLHPTMKPIALIENAILNSTVKDNLIIDFFLGSGSTLIACEQTGRVCYGMEIDPHYCDVIVKRWEDFTGKKAELVK